MLLTAAAQGLLLRSKLCLQSGPLPLCSPGTALLLRQLPAEFQGPGPQRHQLLLSLLPGLHQGLRRRGVLQGRVSSTV